MHERTERFLDKLGAFGQGLDAVEQQMLIELISDSDAEVEGFNLFEAWPAKIADIAPQGISRIDGFLSSGHTTGFKESGSGPTNV